MAEEDPKRQHITSKFLQRPTIQKQLEYLQDAIKNASEVIDYESAHNPKILYALDIIEQFLKKKGRVCYGGTAINALLPDKLKFYDPTKDLPDYDFFTPDLDEDVDDLVKDLQRAGFDDVYERVGIHEGTRKIMVNYVPIADMTYLPATLFSRIYERSVEKKGIRYADPDFLRMMMYLELSRPRGEVERWDKVFERLTLLNAALPMRDCPLSLKKLVGHLRIPTTIRKTILQYVIDNERVLAGADVGVYYNQLLHKDPQKEYSIHWFLHQRNVLVFLSADPTKDADALVKQLRDSSSTIIRGERDIVPERVYISWNDQVVVCIVKETACHAYNLLPLPKKDFLRIASLDTMLTLYLALGIFTDDRYLLGVPILCLCQRMVELNESFRKLGGKGIVPAFSITCSGYQKGFATLLKEKVARIKKEKQNQSTRKATKKSKRTETRRFM
jgi:hypothetical protein